MNRTIGGRNERLDEERCWQDVERREGQADRRFVYGVKSTGIYCIPSCPSRRPNRRQVVFFESCDEAETAGFRACLRCRPREDSTRVKAVVAACQFIESNLEEKLDLATLGAHVGQSPAHLQRVFKRAMGVSPREYADVRRFQNFKRGLKSDASVTEAVYAAGYNSSSRAYERVGARLGMTPTGYRRGGAGQRIRFATAPCPLGRLLVAATPQGICAISLGDEDRALEAELRAEFPAATMSRDDGGLAKAVASLRRRLAGETAELELPLDARATAFQWQVWKALQSIPYGETRSYAEVARAIGKPKAVRAVARACATNPAAILIPCHRVVRGDQQLAGYRWGLERKAALLRQEQSSTAAKRPASAPKKRKSLSPAPGERD